MVGPTPPPGIVIERIDHFVLTVRDLEATCRFYERVLGAAISRFGEGRTAVLLGRQKINLHVAGKEFSPRAQHAVTGGGDFCLIAATPLGQVIEHLKTCGVAIELGPVPKTGATGPIRSVYFRDPDGNLIEVSNYV